jgi:hypothetical protein
VSVVGEQFAPRRTGKPAQAVDLTGMLIPWGQDDQPVFLNMPLSTKLYLPCFSSEDLLVSSLAGVPYEKIKQIDDGREFLSSVPSAIAVIVDPQYGDEPGGLVRFTQVLRG